MGNDGLPWCTPDLPAVLDEHRPENPRYNHNDIAHVQRLRHLPPLSSFYITSQGQTTGSYAHLAADPVKQAATKISDRLALLGATDNPSADTASKSSLSITMKLT